MTTTATAKNKVNAKELHFNTLITKLEEVLTSENPLKNWQRMWMPIKNTNNFIGNAISGKSYSSNNILTCLLDILNNNWLHGQYMTANQLFKFAKDNDTRINIKGKKFIYIWVTFPKYDTDKEGNIIEETKVFLSKAYRMYNVSQFEQVVNSGKLPHVGKIELPETKEFSTEFIE